MALKMSGNISSSIGMALFRFGRLCVECIMLFSLSSDAFLLRVEGRGRSAGE